MLNSLREFQPAKPLPRVFVIECVSKLQLVFICSIMFSIFRKCQCVFNALAIDVGAIGSLVPLLRKNMLTGQANCLFRIDCPLNDIACMLDWFR